LTTLEKRTGREKQQGKRVGHGSYLGEYLVIDQMVEAQRVPAMMIGALEVQRLKRYFRKQ
jgi:hypothetical protein